MARAVLRLTTRAAILAAAIAGLGLAFPAESRAAEAGICVSSDEADAFRLRHLQSRLMVAALGCNQQGAYNTFVERFRADLVSAGGNLTGYFHRTGAGQAGLNTHITRLANAAGLARAQNPEAFCKQSWDLFWSLEQEPMALGLIAEANPLVAISQPLSCAVSRAGAAGLHPANETAALGSAKAAVDEIKP